MNYLIFIFKVIESATNSNFLMNIFLQLEGVNL